MVTAYYTLGEGLSLIDCCICSISRRSIRLSSIAFTSWPCVAVPWVNFWSRLHYLIRLLTIMERKGKI